jgi:NAD(P)-dependent dehydrogenase (short-subunit alcohol dehydrogenase family)
VKNLPSASHGFLSDLFGVEGKTIVVTGASRGLGKAIARGYLQAGARVYICARSEADCAKTVGELSSIGHCEAIAVDLATSEGRAALLGWYVERETALDVLVNNAGTAWGEPLDTHSEHGMEKVLRLNIASLFFVTQMFLPLLDAAGEKDAPSRVINIGSVDGLRVPDADNFGYTASKAGVHMLTRHLAVELAPRSITVNAIAPGLFVTKMTSHWFDDEAMSQAWNAQIALGRTGRDEDIAGAALYLASRAGAWLTGVVLPIAGGTAPADVLPLE